MSDIKLDSNEVIIEAFSQKLEGADLKIDYSPRRTNDSPARRAIVHDFQDGLTINWANDYPGGIRLNGKVRVTELSGTHLMVTHHDLKLDNASRRSSSGGNRRALVHNFSDGLTINYGRDYPGGVTIRGDVNFPEKIIVDGANVMDLIESLQATIASLESRISALEP